MSSARIPIIDRRKARGTLKGRQVDAIAREQIRELLGDRPRRRDLLIEHLHLLQDHFGALHAAHLAALAGEMRLALVEVYEVATFYHHFDVVREDESAPPRLTVRVCDSLSCELAGAKQLLDRLPALLGADVRVMPAPCVGRCAEAPIAVVGQNALERATLDSVAAASSTLRSEPDIPAGIAFAEYRAQRGYELLRECVAGGRDADSVISIMTDSGLRGLGGAGFPAGR